MSKVNVYNENNEIIGRVTYQQNLDRWNGSNWQFGGTGLHGGITKLRKSGLFVQIHGSQWQGSKDYAEIISDDTAKQLVLESGDEELLKKYFPDYEDSLEEE